MNLILCVFVISTLDLSHSTHHPVILIPGLAASPIDAIIKNNSKGDSICQALYNRKVRLWLSLPDLLSCSIDCVLNSLKQTYNNKTHKTSNQPGIYTHIPDFGDTKAVEALDQEGALLFYKPIVERFLQLGYVRNISIRGAPYDFRKGPNELKTYYKKLKKLIEETYKLNGEYKVIIILHSMGGKVMQEFLQTVCQSWKDKFIRFIISLSAVYGGTVSALDASGGFVWHGSGLDLNLFSTTLTEIFSPFWKSLLSAVNNVAANYGRSLVFLPKELMQTFLSIMWLYPSRKAYSKSQVLIETPVKKYTVDTIHEFIKDLGIPDGVQMYHDVLPSVDNDAELGVELYCLYGSGLRTLAEIIYGGTAQNLKKRNSKYSDGDGIVNWQGLELCKKWIKGNKTVTVKSFKGIDHLEMLRNQDVIEYIIQIVTHLGPQQQNKF